MLSKDQIEQTLKNLYIREQWKEMLTNLFAENGSDVNWESKPVEITLGTKTAAYRAKNLFRLGTVLLTDDKVLNIYEAEVQNTSIAENRVGLRTLIQSEIIPGFNDAAVAVFYSPQQTEWRFTFMSKWEYPENSGKVVKHETHPKKFTYVLGPTESNRTARDRFYELQVKEKNLQSVVDAFSVAKLSSEFFMEYRQHYNAFYDYLKNSPFRKSVFEIPKIRDAAENDKAEKPIRDFVKRLLGRIVFLYFLQKKGWLQSVWAEPGEIKPDHAFMSHLLQFADKKKDFYSTFLVPLFFETLNKERRDDVFKIDGENLGKIPYLNGGLFEKDFVEVEKIHFKNELFKSLFQFFDSFNFTIIEDSPDEREVAVDPEMLGHIFENLIEENKKFGTFYTPKEVVHFMTQEALLLHLSKKLTLQSGSEERKALKKFIQYKEPNTFIRQHALSIDAELDSLKVCDPAIGSGAFPMGILLEIYQIKLQLYALTAPGTAFIPAEVKEKIIRNSIYGVDIDKGAIDIARLRFWLSLIVDLPAARPLPNFDYKFMQGNSLKEEFEGIPLHLKEEKKETKNGSLWEVKEPDSFYGFLNKSNINLEKLEEDLFDAHDEKIKAEKRKELNKTEKAYLKSCIDDKLQELKTRIENEWADYRKKTAGLSSKQRDTLKASYQKRVDKLEIENDDFKEKAQRLKEFNEYEKKYFLWHLYFKHVFDNGGFDIVIANPPYGVPVDDEFYKNSILGSKDSYGFFIKLAIETLLKPGGTLVYIVSDTWLTIKSHLQLRQLVLQNQLHKVVRLHPDTFGAVVNTCIVSLSKTIPPTETDLLAADLTNLSTRKALPEFREKLFHLDEFVGDYNESYAVYKYPQKLISTNSNMPVFTASPKLFVLMNDTSYEKESRTIQDEEEKKIEIRKIKYNDRVVDLVRFGDDYKKEFGKKVWLNVGISKIISGIKTGSNDECVFKSLAAHGSYEIVDTSKVLSEKEIISLTETEKSNGIDPKKYNGKRLVPFDKGGGSNTQEGLLPNYYINTQYYLDWSKKSVKQMYSQPHSDMANEEFRFVQGLTYSRTGQYAPTFRINQGGILESKSCGIFSDVIDETVLLALLCSRPVKYFIKNYLMHTVESSVGTLPLLNLPSVETNFEKRLKQYTHAIIEKQKNNVSYNYLINEQKEIDRLVYELYGLSEEDIQEIEYWWARRYQKLARFADTKPRLKVKDKQEQLARLQEIIARGENKYCEFKSSLRLDIRNNIADKKIEHAAFKNIAAFLNCEGGTLIIGVDDEKNILGLEETDYKTFSKADKLDEWNKHLDNLIQNFLGNKMHAFLQTKHILVDGKTIAVIDVKPSPEPVWLKSGGNEEFYIRRTASAIALNGSEAMEYIKSHWE